jgi:hypothetical protein
MSTTSWSIARLVNLRRITMTDKEKMLLISKIVADSYEYSGDSTSRTGFLEGTLSAIEVVIRFGEEET